MRTFIAIELSSEIKEALAAASGEIQAKVRGHIKWVDPDSIHLTLKFLGDTDESNIAKIKNALKKTSSQTPPFTISLGSAGAFPSPDRPRVIWISIKKGEDECANLATSLEDGLEQLGFEREAREFHPHLTLARVKSLTNRRSLKGALAGLNIPPLEMAASKITLFQSSLTPTGPP